MKNKSEVIKTFNNSRLIDIVKNYKRYGYEAYLKDEALQILKDRGVDEETLRLTGNLTDYEFDTANNLFDSFNKNSKLAFLFYGIMFFMIFINALSQLSILYAIEFATMILCFIFIIKSLISYSDFYKALGKDISAWTYISYIILGIFAYFYVYFFYKKEMKEDLKLIN